MFRSIKEKLENYKKRDLSQTTQKRSAVALILRFDEKTNDPFLAFIKRAQRQGDPWSGQMGFPGGREEKIDQTLLETAARETIEEIGIDLHETTRFCGEIDDMPVFAEGRKIDLIVRPFVFRQEKSMSPILDLKEVESLHWLSLSQDKLEKMKTIYPYELGGKVYDLPAYRLDEYLVWGLSYRILENFMRILRET